MIGSVFESYAEGVSIHEGYNRAIGITGCHYLRLYYNVAYHVKGHNFSIVNAIESKNTIKGNLVMRTTASQSLLETDKTPASFYITYPDNEFLNNHAAGSDGYGFWYDLQEHPTGLSADVTICSENS